MDYVVRECGDDTNHLQTMLNDIARGGGRVVSITYKPEGKEWTPSWVVVAEYRADADRT
jgi:hypothetical protein